MKMESEPGLKVYRPPKEWEDFAREKGIEKLYLINNRELNNSFHFYDTIYLNIREDKWRYYSTIIDIDSYEEAMTCKFLHEIAHLIFKHKYIGFKSALRETEYDFEVAVEKVASARILQDRSEREAWEYVFEFRGRYSADYRRLVEAFRTWLQELRKDLE